MLAVVSSQEVAALDSEVRTQNAQRAERIRGLVNVAGGCVVEAGLLLLEASGDIPRGQWAAWLKEEFGWSADTARVYMNVAQAAQNRPGRFGSPDVTIDAKALYLLARPSIPQEIRDEALRRAEEGERITLAEAEKLIIEAVTAKVEEQRKASYEQLKAAVKAAKERAAGDVQKLKAYIAEIKAEQKKPTIDTVIAMICKITGKKKLSKREMQGIALATGASISDGKHIYPATTPEESAAAERDVQTASQFVRALEYFGAAPPAEDVFRACLPWVHEAAKRQIPLALEFLSRFQMLLGDNA
jgi:hypothetical protein